jgi:DNA-binding NarL/FixJ family response regulator
VEERRVIRVLIVAAYTSVRAGLQVLLADAEDCAIQGEARGSAELERLLPELRPDVVLLDDNEDDRARLLDVMSGGETGLVMLGDSRGVFRLLANASLPGWAYLLREADGPEIQAAVRAVDAGLVVLDRSMAPLLSRAGPSAAEGQCDVLPDEALTPREREVMQLMAEGLPNKLIASRLSISLHTVKFHVASILAKLGAASRTEAVTLGARRGYVTL